MNETDSQADLKAYADRWKLAGEQLRKIEVVEMERLDLASFLTTMEGAFEYAGNTIPLRKPEDMVMIAMRKQLDKLKNEQAIDGGNPDSGFFPGQ